MQIGFHTDAFNSVFWPFDKCVEWAAANDIHYIESGIMDGVSWAHGLGYWPHVATFEDPVALRQFMEKHNVQYSQIDAAFPLSGSLGASIGVPYVWRAIQWAKLVGCPRIATTDGLFAAKGYTDDQAMELMKWCYGQIIELAEKNEMTITIEIHGYYTTKPEFLGRMLEFCDSPYFGLNLDTGNSYIAGQDPVDFARRFGKKVKHMHIKDVTEQLSASNRGEDTGIPISHSAIGDGVNADNIKESLKIVHELGFNGPISLEVEGNGGPTLIKSLNWIRKTLTELGIPEEK